jgi:hypothetical protein
MTKTGFKLNRLFKIILVYRGLAIKERKPKVFGNYSNILTKYMIWRQKCGSNTTLILPDGESAIAQ